MSDFAYQKEEHADGSGLDSAARNATHGGKVPINANPWGPMTLSAAHDLLLKMRSALNDDQEPLPPPRGGTVANRIQTKALMHAAVSAIVTPPSPIPPQATRASSAST